MTALLLSGIAVALTGLGWSMVQIVGSYRQLTKRNGRK